MDSYGIIDAMSLGFVKALIKEHKVLFGSFSGNFYL